MPRNRRWSSKPAVMQINSFDDLITAGLREPDPQLLLVVLLRALPESAEGNLNTDGDSRGHGTLVPVMATEFRLSSELRLDSIVEEADSLEQAWDLIMVSSLSSGNGRLPEPSEAEPYLRQMAEAIQAGADLSRYAVFNRAGCPVSVQTL